MIKTKAKRCELHIKGDYADLLHEFSAICAGMAAVTKEYADIAGEESGILQLQNAMLTAMYADETGILMKSFRVEKIRDGGE